MNATNVVAAIIATLFCCVGPMVLMFLAGLLIGARNADKFAAMPSFGAARPNAKFMVRR